MNKIKKIAIGALLAVGAGCLAAAAGCSEPDYFTLTFEGTGLDYVYQGELAPEEGDQFINGYEVMSGLEIRFTVAVAETSVGTPVIKLNGEEMTPDADGVYSFVIDRDSVVSAHGLEETRKVTFGANDYYKFIDEKGEQISGDVTVVKGDDVKFKVWISPYMVGDYAVTSGSEQLEPDADGYYTASNITTDSTIEIRGLEQDEDFLARGDGSGTADDPFRLRKPIDLFAVAALVNSDQLMLFSTAHYRLEEDIDMQGEKLFVIGDMSIETAMFCGTFDGNNHKISNFYMTDEVYDQQSFKKAYLQFVGVFGVANALQTSPAVIKNLTLEDYEVTIHPELTTSAYASYAGSLVAYGVGVQIDNCKLVNGKVVSNSDNKLSYIGGMVGVLQSAFNDTLGVVTTYDSYVNGCSADVEVTGRGSIRCAGGIAGILTTADTQAIAYISNCVSTGSVKKAMFSGGIVGDLGRYSSVANCYSSSAVSAENSIVSSGTNATLKSAYAGGIVGFAENDTVITGCYSANSSIKATSAANIQSTGAICGKADDALAIATDAAECVLYKNLDKSAGNTASVFISRLGWDANEWDLKGEVPVYVGAQAARTVKIKVVNDGNVIGTYENQIKTPVPIYAWYGDVMDEYVTSPQGRSWGYYFDRELTQKVPYGYLPLSDEEVYVGFADYSSVAGSYHLVGSTYGNDAGFVLDSEGGYSFRDGGMSLVGTYSYDGEKITLFNSCLGAMEYSTQEIESAYVTMVMEKSQNGYTLNGKINVSDNLEAFSLTAVKQSDSFTYGEYVNGEGVLLLKPNGTGSYTVNGNVRQFTFTITADGIKLSNNFPVKVVDGKVTEFVGKAASLKDGFAGVWQKNAASTLAYSFDGFGVVKLGSETGTYEEVEKGKAVITLGGAQSEAVIASDGALYIDGVAYYLSDGFTGGWYGRPVDNEKETIELILGGVGANGFGEAQMTFSSGVNYSVNGQYAVIDGVMAIYVGDTLYGELNINKSTGTAYGPFFSYTLYNKYKTVSYANAEFKLYDMFKGVWVCDAEGVSAISFTGKSAEGENAIVTDANGNDTTVKYSIKTATTGTVTIGGKTYSMTLDEKAGKVALTLEQSAAGSLAKRDGWYGATLYDGETAYKFDGNGNLSGKVAVDGGATLNYTMGANGLPVVDGEALVETNGGFEWKGKLLAFKTGFAKSWLMPVTNERITIEEVTTKFTAQVTIGTEVYTFKYNPERNTLTNTQVDVKGVKTEMVIASAGSKDISLSITRLNTEEYVCVDEELKDGWLGSYQAADGSVWVFDGHGLSSAKGRATYTDANGKKTNYSYVKNEFGLIYIQTGLRSGMVFAETQTGYSKQGDDKAYSPVVADEMYLKEVSLNGEFVVYDGTGSLRRSADGTKTEYTYFVLTSKCSVISGQGSKKLGKITDSGSISVLSLEEYKEWSLASNSTVKYVFDGTAEKGGLWLVDGDGYTRKYYYQVSVDSASEYFLTDMDEKSYKMTLNKTDNTFVLEEIKDED